MEGLSFVLAHVEYKVVLFNLAVLRWESSSNPGDLMETHFILSALKEGRFESWYEPIFTRMQIFYTNIKRITEETKVWQCRHDSSISFGVKLGAVQRLSRRWSINANELYFNTASELRLKLSAWNRVTRSILTWTFT